jgi:hypothetical protein
MISINHENNIYINMDYLLINAPIYSKGCRSSRGIIKKKNIEDNKYIYAREKNNEWIITNGNSSKVDKIFIIKSIIENIPELNNNELVIDDNGIEKAPKLIKLNDTEKFKDDEDNIIEIQTRGERKYDKIYFRVKDVSIGFDILRLQDIILDKNTKYIINNHYKYFLSNKPNDIDKKTDKKSNSNTLIKKELYLTYQGILRLLFVSENNKTSKFISWVTEKLFTLQMGTIEQKEELISSVLGVNAKIIKEVFNINRNTLPCIYLFTLNTVKELRTSMNIDRKYSDDSIVAKFGFTKDLSRRTGEHINRYNKIENVNLKLKYYSYIDPQYMSNAETDIKDLMLGFKIKLNFENEDELIIIPKELIRIVERQYEVIGKSYMGHISELITKIKELKENNDKQLLKHELELLNSRHELESQNSKYNLDLQSSKHENILLNKDLEIIKLQIQLNNR